VFICRGSICRCSISRVMPVRIHLLEFICQGHPSLETLCFHLAPDSSSRLLRHRPRCCQLVRVPPSPFTSPLQCIMSLRPFRRHLVIVSSIGSALYVFASFVAVCCCSGRCCCCCLSLQSVVVPVVVGSVDGIGPVVCHFMMLLVSQRR